MNKYTEPLEVGKFYKRINGQKCLCAYIDPVGLPYTLSMNAFGHPYTIVHHSDIFGGNDVSELSIVAEWVDSIPLVEKWANIYPDGTIAVHSSKKSAMSNAMKGARTIFLREVVNN